MPPGPFMAAQKYGLGTCKFSIFERSFCTAANMIIRLAFSLLLLVLMGCGEESPKASPKTVEQIEEELLKMNQDMVATEEDRIEAFISRRAWDMMQTGTGLYYSIEGEGSGVPPEVDQLVSVNYKIQLLNGEDVYASKVEDPENFVLGKDQVESGLHEGLQLMKVGQKARFIIPPHLAHGLTGDRNKIPSNATLVVFIELLEIR